MSLFKTSTLVCISALLGACGGSIGHDTPVSGTTNHDVISSSSVSTSSSSSSSEASSGSNNSASVHHGFFIDSAVANLHYQSQSTSGNTNAKGEFDYVDGEKITFSIGALKFPAVTAQPTVTPLTLAGTTDVNDQRAINIVRLLLSLDKDRNPDNGIEIDDLAHSAATQIDFSLDSAAFAASSAVTNLLANSGASSMTLVSQSDAKDHFQAALADSVNHRIVVKANGPGNTYELFDSKLGGGADVVETPVCPDDTDDAYGRRITEVKDDTLDEYVFKFHLVLDKDGDRCQKDVNDRQRIEVKTFDKSPKDRTAQEGEIHTYRWKFKLPEGFQPSSSFTHIFQIKAAGGDDHDKPIVTFTPRSPHNGVPARLEVLHAPSHFIGESEKAHAKLADLKGHWVEAFVRTLNANDGSLQVRLVRLSDNKTLIDWSANHIDMWRKNAELNRPKWGLYRSLKHPEMMRDENVYFNDICIAEGSNTCPSSVTGSGDSDGGSSSSSSSTSSAKPDLSFEDQTVGEQPTGADEVEGSPIISDEKALDGSQSVKVVHPTAGQQNRFRYSFTPKNTGSFSASVFIPAGISADTLISLYGGEDYSSANRVIDNIFKDDNEFRARTASDGQTKVAEYSEGQWNTVKVSWENIDTSNEYTLWLNGTKIGTEEVSTHGLIPARVEFKFGGNADDIDSNPVYFDSIDFPATDDSSSSSSSSSEASSSSSSETSSSEASSSSSSAASGTLYSFESDTVGQAPSNIQDASKSDAGSGHDTDALGVVQVSDDKALDGTKSLKFTHPVEHIDVRTHNNWGPKDSGSMEASVYIPANVNADFLMTVYGDDYSSSYRAMDILFKPDGRVKRRTPTGQEETTTYNADAWNTVKLTWTDISTSHQYTLWVNGVEQGTFDEVTAGQIPARVEFKFGSNSEDTSPTSVYLDSVKSFE